MDAGGFSAVLFDWRGTLFHNESDRDWILASAAAIGRQTAENEAGLLAQALADVDQHPQVREARQQADCSLALHRAATLLQLRLAGFDPDLALAVWCPDTTHWCCQSRPWPGASASPDAYSRRRSAMTPIVASPR